jgi:phosphoglycerate dehydrogenase-like enzyme
MGDYYDEFKEISNISYSNKTAGWTAQAKERLSHKVIENMNTFLNKK